MLTVLDHKDLPNRFKHAFLQGHTVSQRPPWILCPIGINVFFQKRNDLVTWEYYGFIWSNVNLIWFLLVFHMVQYGWIIWVNQCLQYVLIWSNVFEFPSITSIFDGWNTYHVWDFLRAGKHYVDILVKSLGLLWPWMMVGSRYSAQIGWPCRHWLSLTHY